MLLDLLVFLLGVWLDCDELKLEFKLRGLELANGRSCCWQVGQNHVQESPWSSKCWYSCIDSPQQLACVQLSHLSHRMAWSASLTALLQSVHGYITLGPGLSSMSPALTKIQQINILDSGAFLSGSDRWERFTEVAIMSNACSWRTGGENLMAVMSWISTGVVTRLFRVVGDRRSMTTPTMNRSIASLHFIAEVWKFCNTSSAWSIVARLTVNCSMMLALPLDLQRELLVEFINTNQTALNGALSCYDGAATMGRG